MLARKKKVIGFLLAALAIGWTGGLEAAQRRPKVQPPGAKARRHAARLYHRGVESGRFTDAEKQRLKEEGQKIREARRDLAEARKSALSDGKLTEQEKEQLRVRQQALAQASKNLLKETQEMYRNTERAAPSGSVE